MKKKPLLEDVRWTVQECRIDTNVSEAKGVRYILTWSQETSSRSPERSFPPPHQCHLVPRECNRVLLNKGKTTFSSL